MINGATVPRRLSIDRDVDDVTPIFTTTTSWPQLLLLGEVLVMQSYVQICGKEAQGEET